MEKRLLIVARDFTAAKHWALRKRMSPGCWVYVSSYHNICGNAGSDYVLLDGWNLRVDADLLRDTLAEQKCAERRV